MSGDFVTSRSETPEVGTRDSAIRNGMEETVWAREVEGKSDGVIAVLTLADIKDGTLRALRADRSTDPEPDSLRFRRGAGQDDPRTTQANVFNPGRPGFKLLVGGPKP
jgi:hypothetical protein